MVIERRRSLITFGCTTIHTVVLTADVFQLFTKKKVENAEKNIPGMTKCAGTQEHSDLDVREKAKRLFFFYSASCLHFS